MDNQPQAPSLEPLPTYPARNQKKSRRLVKIIAIIVAIALLVFLGKKLFGGSKKEETKLPPTPTPTEFQFPTDTPQPSVSVSPTEGATPSPTAKASANSVDSKTGLDRASVSVEVLNGSGAVGAASKASDTLKALGYNVTSSGNADNFDFAQTEIHVKSTKSKFLSLVKSDLSNSYTIGIAAADLDSSASADIQVIVGKE